MTQPIDTASQPMQWHDESWQRLLQQTAQQRLPHALLLAGPAGCGKRQFAAAAAALWLCNAPQPQGACGKCQSCHLMQVGSHPDVLFPETSGKSEQLRVNEIRDVVDFCAKTGQMGQRRLVLLQPACHMNRSAQNALLKTLEEPGDGTLLLLVADSPQLLLPTIKSRCQQWYFAPPSMADALAWLQQQGQQSGAAEAALAATAGAPLQAAAVLESDWFQQRQEWMTLLLQLTGGTASLSAASRQLAKYPQHEFLQALCHWAHYALRSGFLHQKPDDAALQQMIELIRRIGARALSRWHDSLQEAVGRLERSANLNKTLQLDQLLWMLTPSGVATTLKNNALA